jgi:hypothetical protein
MRASLDGQPTRWPRSAGQSIMTNKKATSRTLPISIQSASVRSVTGIPLPLCDSWLRQTAQLTNGKRRTDADGAGELVLTLNRIWHDHLSSGN